MIGSFIAVLGVFLSSKSSETKSDEIASLSRQNAELSAKVAAYATGGNSYFYLHVNDYGTDNPTADIRHEGDNPIRDAEIIIFDVTGQIPDIASGQTTRYDLENAPQVTVRVAVSYPHGARHLTQFPFERNPSNSFYAYFIHVYANNGNVRQQLQLEKVEGTWQQAYVVERDDEGTLRPLTQHFDDAFTEDQIGRLKHQVTQRQ
ncbi:MAG: hypothetical protein IIA07_08540 [Proteobacteria bacterium]|nr:hypothetical protein [Pseudomonadota bacterium]